MNSHQSKDNQNVKNPPINLMGVISRCTIFRLKLHETKTQLPSNIFNDIAVTPVTVQGFNEDYNSLSTIVETLYNNSTSDLLQRASYIVQGEQYLKIVKDYLKQIQISQADH